MRKLLKKLIFSAFVLAVAVAPLSTKALAASSNNLNKITVEQTKYYNTVVEKTYNVSDYNQLYDAVKASINNVEASFKIVLKNNYLENTPQKVSETLKKVVDYVSPGEYILGYEVSYSNNSEYYIKYKYDRTVAQIKTQKSEVTKKINETMPKIVYSSMSSYDKVKAIHDYIINTTSYDRTQVSSIPRESHTAYGALINKTAVCEGYASAMKKMLDYVGIENMIITGEAGKGSPKVGHAWNLVKINNKWTHVDATWDDPITYVNGQIVPVLKYDYFDKTDEYMSSTHSWVKSNYPKTGLEVYKNGKRNLPVQYSIYHY